MAQFRFAEAVRRVVDHLETTQADNIEAASQLVVHALRNKGAVFCSEIGHGNQGDFLNRAGGLAAVQAFTYSLSVGDATAECVADRPAPEILDRETETARLAVRTSRLRAGDVMLIGSVSGKNVRPVGLALACREAGVKVVGLTAMEYTRQVQSLHPSGMRLCDAADVVIDIGAPYGDAAVDIPGIDVTVMPVSGVGFTVAGWLLWERVITTMADTGDPPTVFMSVNREGGQDYYKAARARFNDKGY